jgi:hypothetical protein
MAYLVVFCIGVALQTGGTTLAPFVIGRVFAGTYHTMSTRRGTDSRSQVSVSEERLASSPCTSPSALPSTSVEPLSLVTSGLSPG